MFRALRLRLAIGNALLLATLLIGLGFVGTRVYRERVDDQATAELRGRARDLSRVIEAEGPEAIPGHHDDPSDASILVAVFGADGRFVGGSEAPPDWLRPQASALVDSVVGDGDPVRFVTRSVTLPDGSRATLVLARSLERLVANLADLEALFRSGALQMLLLSALFGWWISGRMIRPVARSYEAQRTFASDASHELRTPLTFIRAGVEVLAPSRPELGAQVLGEIDYMTSLTERLLLLARAEEGDLHPAARSFELAAVCRSAAARAHGAHGLEVAAPDPSTRAILALGDPILTETILDVLLENVARYGGGTAEIDCGPAGDGVTVRVVDRGRGLSEEDRDRIFERFARIEPSRDRTSGGAGLGLPLARSLARAQGGDLRLSPTPGGGLTATIELPAGGSAEVA